jgi:pimeloyl-ACP methyl ester carboxylesterase
MELKRLNFTEPTARFVIAAAALMIFAGCMTLDPLVFNGEKTTAYQLDAYTGDRECSDAVDSLGPLKADNVRLVRVISGNHSIVGHFLNADSICKGTDTLICYFHGTGPNNDFYWPRIRLLYATGHPVFAIDYQGYGMSTGTPTEDGIYEDGQAALSWLRVYLGNPQVVVYAYSLGSLVGCELAATDTRKQIIQLILEAPIGSMETLVQDGSYLNVPGSYLTSFDGDNVKKIEQVTVPLLWLHGTNDETLNRETNGLRVWNNYRGVRGCFYRAEGAGHRTIPQNFGYGDYIACVRDFISGSNNTHLTCSR